MKNIIFFLLIIITITSCKETSSEVTDADDYMPFASNTFVCHWGGGAEIKYYIEDGSSVTGYDDRFLNNLNEVLIIWRNALKQYEIDLTLTEVSQLADSDLAFKWDDGTDLASGVVGYASIDTKKNEYPYRIIVLTTFSSHSDNLFKTIVLHEMGHMLGIWNHSFDQQDIMYPYAENYEKQLTKRDLATLKYLYSISPDMNIKNLSSNIDSNFTFKIKDVFVISKDYNKPLITFQN